MCSNTELAVKIKGLETQIDGLMELGAQSAASQKEKLTAILEQAVKTNGRVSECECNLRKLRFWSWLTDKPHRLITSIFGLVAVVNLTDFEKIVELFLKIFSCGGQTNGGIFVGIVFCVFYLRMGEQENWKE